MPRQSSWHCWQPAAHFVLTARALFSQLVTEQESQLAEQKQLLGELQGTVSQLQAEVLAGQRHLQRQQQAQEVLQSQAETLQHRELQARVALEQVTSRVSEGLLTSGSHHPPGRHFSHFKQRAQKLSDSFGQKHSRRCPRALQPFGLGASLSLQLPKQQLRQFLSQLFRVQLSCHPQSKQASAEALEFSTVTAPHFQYPSRLQHL